MCTFPSDLLGFLTKCKLVSNNGVNETIIHSKQHGYYSLNTKPQDASGIQSTLWEIMQLLNFSEALVWKFRK